jgi:thermostable 8-oxoguanine DNA glycosylase
MTQTAAVFCGHLVTQVELPDPEVELMPGVTWGAVDSFPSPAYWLYQVVARRIAGETIRYRLGQTLSQEVAACLLGGHGMHSSVGLAYFEALKSDGLLNGTPSEQALLARLSEPVYLNGRPVHYRFARQRARYIARALERLNWEPAPERSGRELRDWLMQLPGIGPKTASWIARNWLDADDVAILDVHILRAGLVAGFMSRDYTVERHYLELEQQFIAFSRALGVRASELDSVIWLEMMSSPGTVRRLQEGPALSSKRSTAGAQQRDANASQARSWV